MIRANKYNFLGKQCNNQYQELTHHPNSWSSKLVLKELQKLKKVIYAKIIVKNKEQYQFLKMQINIKWITNSDNIYISH